MYLHVFTMNVLSRLYVAFLFLKFAIFNRRLYFYRYGTISYANSNKYLIAGVAFIIWMCFFDRYDFSTQFAYQQEKTKLEDEKAYYETEIGRIEKAIKDAQYNPNEIQRIARERYKMKKDNEDIFVIQEVEAKEEK